MFYDWSTQGVWLQGAWATGAWLAGAFFPGVWGPMNMTAFYAQLPLPAPVADITQPSSRQTNFG